MAGGYYSTPFDSAGNVTASWSQNLFDFLSDLKAYGIVSVTPTPVFDPWSGPGSMMQSRTVQTCGVWKTLKFVPWLPYGFDPSDNDWPDRTCGNDSYFHAARTPADVFWGWQRFFDLMNVVMTRVQQAQLSFGAFDYFQETNMFGFTVLARLIYDFNAGGLSVDVLQELRNRMASNGFSSGRVIPSTNTPPTPTPASGNCGSYYGDSALLATLTAQTAALAGPWSAFGTPPGHVEYGQLWCWAPGDPVGAPLVSVPVWHSQPTATDIHAQKYYSLDSDTQAYSSSFHSSMWAFLTYRGLTGNDVVFGEHNPVSCDGYSYSAAQAMINGYKNSSLYANHAGKVVLRPWHRTEAGFACVTSPHVINPPYDPLTF